MNVNLRNVTGTTEPTPRTREPRGNMSTAWPMESCIFVQPLNTMNAPLHCCRMCGSTSYRRVLARDESGSMRATELYQCSGCSVVFADPKAWREGGADPLPVRPPADRPPPPSPPAVNPRSFSGPNLTTYGLTPGSSNRS
jgi:hypothetical protein